MDNETVLSVTFGDADTGTDKFSVSVDPVLGCVRHPAGKLENLGNNIFHYAGVDLGVCILDDEDPNYVKLANLPVAPLMVPTGCVRDWLRYEVRVIHGCPQSQKKGRTGCTPLLSLPTDGTYPGVDSVAVGMGWEFGSQSGHKRSFNPTLYTQVNNEGTGGFGASFPGSPTQIASQTAHDWNGTPHVGNGTQVGDSGGPLLYRLPDSTWWVIADLNGAGTFGMDFYEAAPAYMHWIESVTQRDVTPCHDLNSEHDFVWNGDCVGFLPTTLHESGGGTWGNSCSAHDVGGQLCGGWGPTSPLDLDSGIQPMPNHPWAPFAAVQAHCSSARSLAGSGFFGNPVDVDVVQAYLYDRAFDFSAYTFLADIFNAGVVGGYTSVALVGEEAWGFWGEVLIAGDFNCDGYEDLAVGAPRATIDGVHEAGSVHVIYGSAGGLSTVSAQFYEGRAGVGDDAETEDHFGASLASGHFNGDACSDLAIGVPGEDVGTTTDVGKVHVLYGRSTGLPQNADLSLIQGQGGVADSADANDRFGARLEVAGASGDVLRVLVPNELCSSSADHPMVGWHVFQGGGSGLELGTDVLECEVLLGSPMSTADWGDLEQISRLYAVRIAREATP